MITRIQARVTRLRDEVARARRAFDGERQRHSRETLAEVAGSLSAMRSDWQLPGAAAEGVQAWVYSRMLWRPFRKWSLIVAIGIWFFALLAITDYPDSPSARIPLSVNTLFVVGSWLKTKSSGALDDPGAMLGFIKGLALRWGFMIAVLYVLFRGLPNAKVRRELDPPAWTHPLQRWGKTLVWTASLERRFRTTAILVLGAHQCAVVYGRKGLRGGRRRPTCSKGLW
ncbi:hypothetical protein [Streptomyces atratus]|uniref:hypothetical protein n=1 Tax=Streptomyces atratus TaxID=1893 RepID=UPI0011613402|nr:hypothetical protein [Streptomyces atratus]